GRHRQGQHGDALQGKRSHWRSPRFCSGVIVQTVFWWARFVVCAERTKSTANQQRLALDD
ncbi:MAG TPA: hypothetical protein DD442_00215, partial [Halomonas sp.]|nr:hypothetical protein [Halomonas sp.]